MKLVALVLAATATFEHLRLARLVARSVTNADVTLMWFTARDFGAAHLRQPNVFGQTYGSNLEALPMEALRRAGMDLPLATLVVWALVAVGGWVALAAAARARGRGGLALVALAAPLVLSAYYSFVVTTVATYQGAHLLVVAGAAALIATSGQGRAEAGGWAALGLGMALDASGALLGMPVAAWSLLAHPRSRARLRWVGAGLALPLAYGGWWAWFYRAHPDHDVFGGTSLRPSLATLTDNLGRPARFFALFAPEVGHAWWVVLVVGAVLVGAVLVGAVLARPRLATVLPALAVPALVAWGMATPKSVWDFGRFLSPARLFALLPQALWFLALVVAEAAPGPRRRAWGRRRPAKVAVAGVVVLALASAGLRLGDYQHRVVRLRDAATTAVYGFATPVRRLERDCARLASAARRVGASVEVFLTDKVGAYGCGALDYGRIDTLLPAVERRTWRLYEERGRTRGAALLQGVGPDYCDYARPRVRTCRDLGGGVVALTFARQSLLALLERLNVAVRAFGPHCHPEPFGLGAFLCPNGLRPSLAELTTGPPPPDAGAARAAVANAFTRALDPDAGFVTVEDGAAAGAKERARGLAHIAALRRARVRVDAVHFLNEEQAAVDFQVIATGPAFSRALRGWAIRRDGAWLVDRNTFCAVAWSATFEGDIDFRKRLGGCSGEEIARPSR